MSISVSFNAATIWKPGAYSKTQIDLSGAFPLGVTGIVALIGEADAGKPGDEEANISQNVFGPDQMSDIIAKYKSGPLVDAAQFAFAPASDGAIPSGAQALYIYKTNSASRASMVLDNSWGTVKAIEYGVGGNLVTYKNAVTPEVTAQALSSSAVNLTVGPFANSSTFSMHVDGSKLYTFTFPSNAQATIITKITLVSALANPSNWSDVAILTAPIHFTVGGTDSAATLLIKMNGESDSPAVDTHQLGHSRSIELIDGTGTPLASANIAQGFYIPATEASGSLQLNNTRDLLVETGSLGGHIVLKVGYSGSGTTATMSVTSAAILLKVDGSTVATFNKIDYPTIKNLIDAINLHSGWSAEVGSPEFNSLSLSVLDRESDIGALGASSWKPARVKKDAYEVQQMFVSSQIASLTVGANSYCGLPNVKVETALGSGAKGGTVNADIANALTALTKFRVNAVIPLFSRDATADVSDSLTDTSSTYTITSIHQAVKNHLSFTSTTKKRSERQGYLSMKDTYANCKLQSATLADARIQLMIQDIKQNDASNNLKWFLPWALAVLFGGARSGAPVGTPMTFKYLNCTGIRHTAQPMVTPESDIVQDFDPDTQYDDAIQSGVTFVENPQSGGFRVVVDNTTYNRDANWVYNRGNVLYAADVLAYDFRNQLESIYVGAKNTVKAEEVKSTSETILATYLAQGITVSTPDAPNGFKGLVVRIVGNIIYIDVTVKLVEGIDFVLATITLERVKAAA
jgi:hypothetical protein